MAEFAELYCEVICPNCGAEFLCADGRIRFHWGSFPYTYQIGDPVNWETSPSGFSYGASTATHVVALDGDGNVSVWTCDNCAAEFGGVGVVILNDRISGIHFLSHRDLANVPPDADCEALVMRHDGYFPYDAS